MFRRFFPSMTAVSVADVDYGALYAAGVRGIIFDIDNTLEGYDSPLPSERTEKLLSSLLQTGFSVCFASNNNRQRVERFNSTLNLPCLYKAGKPKKSVVERAAKLMNVPKEAIVLIGDQIFTDVWCGNRCGIRTVLVTSLTAYDPWSVSIKRIPEKLILRFYKKYLKNK